jgi:ribosome-binding factor A
VSGRQKPVRRYPRSARVNEVLREVVAEEIERLGDTDERLSMLTVTAVESSPDLAKATVLLSSLGDEAGEALRGARVRIQSAIGSQVRLKRTPHLRFEADPAVARAERVEQIMRRIARHGDA